MLYIHPMECYSFLKKRENSAIYDNMNEPGEHYTKGNKPVIEE